MIGKGNFVVTLKPDQSLYYSYYYQTGSDDTLRSVYRRAKPKDPDAIAADVAPFTYQGSMAETAGISLFL